MLAGYLERRPATLTREQVEQARASVATALNEHRAQALEASRSTRPVSRRWQATKTRLFR
jgi:hypothetical protein